MLRAIYIRENICYHRTILVDRRIADHKFCDRLLNGDRRPHQVLVLEGAVILIQVADKLDLVSFLQVQRSFAGNIEILWNYH